MDNKERFYAWLKAAALILWGFISLITAVAVWNAAAGEKPAGFYCVVAGLNVIINGVAIYYAKKLLFKNE